MPTPPKFVTETVEYRFSNAELIEIAREQARFNNGLRQAEERFISIRADHKLTVTQLQADISKCNLRITSGYEMRDVKSLVLKGRPEADSAMVVRLDNGRVIRVRKLGDDEKQLKLAVAVEPVVFHADFLEDSAGGVLVILAENVPLTAAEADALKPVVSMRAVNTESGSEAQ